MNEILTRFAGSDTNRDRYYSSQQVQIYILQSKLKNFVLLLDMACRKVLDSLKKYSEADLKLCESSASESEENNNKYQSNRKTNQPNLSENQKRLILQKSVSLPKFQEEKNIKITFLNEFKEQTENHTTLSAKFSKIQKADCQIDQPTIDDRVKITENGEITKEITVRSHYHCSRQLCDCKDFDVIAYRAKKNTENEKIEGYSKEEVNNLQKVLPKGLKIVGKKSLKRKKKTSEKNKMRGAIVKLSKEVRELREVISNVVRK